MSVPPTLHGAAHRVLQIQEHGPAQDLLQTLHGIQATLFIRHGRGQNGTRQMLQPITQLQARLNADTNVTSVIYGMEVPVIIRELKTAQVFRQILHGTLFQA